MRRPRPSFTDRPWVTEARWLDDRGVEHYHLSTALMPTPGGAVLSSIASLVPISCADLLAATAPPPGTPPFKRKPRK